MNDKELAYAKQAVFSTRSWDIFQRLMRFALSGPPAGQGRSFAGRPIKKASPVAPLLLVVLVLLGPGFGAGKALAMSRTIKSEPAIIIAAFGTTTKARATYDFFETQLRRELPVKWQAAPIAWAFTSEIVRERANQKFAESGQQLRFRSLAQVLADLDDQGYRKIAVQSLHIFPGQEYEDLAKTIDSFRGLGLRIEYGGTLLQEWEQVFAAIAELESSFLSPDQGCNLLVGHGTPRTFAGANATYLGLDRYLSRKYPHVFIGTVAGVLTRDQALEQVRSYPVKKVRVLPFMYVAGDHIMNDIMADKAAKDGTPSWSLELKESGLAVEAVHEDFNGERLYKGLGFYPGINRMLIQQLLEMLARLAPSS